MKKHFLLIIALIFGANVINAQLPSGSYSDYFREGSFLMLEENYDLALKNFLAAYKIDSSSANINFNVGYCYLNSSTKKAWAERYLAKAVTDINKNYRTDDPSEKSASPLALFDYARALHINYKFDEAIAQYDNFEKTYVKDKTNRDEVEYNKMQSVYAKELVAAPINVTVQNMGDSINSEYPDFSPVMSADERMMIYTTRRNTSTGGEKTPEGAYFEDIVVAYKNDRGVWSSPKSISPFINTNGHDAAVFLTPDEQTLVTFRDDNGDGNVYYSNWDGKDWSSLQQFGSDVNTKYWETHACLSADKNTLYFVSDRPGGYGGRDIYRCVKLPNGAWSKALNVGPTINTKYDEDGPFIHPDGITLIFASKGHKSMGGFDIFVSIMEEDKKFSEPENMRCPINTPDDDVFFVTSPDGKRGYFSSAKEGGFGEKDIYTMFIPDAKEKPLVLFKGSILPADGEKLPEELEIIVTNKETGEIVGKYRPRENGSFSTILPPNKNYNFSYQAKGEEFYNEDIYVSDDLAYQEIKKEINLEPVSLLGKVKVKNKSVLLTTVVLNNPKDKAHVGNAKITLTEKGGKEINYDVDDKGKKEDTPLAFDKLYTIYAEANGKKSAVSSFNTAGIKGSKSITQVLYIDGKAAKTFDLFLNVLTVNKKRKALPNVTVTLTGNDGSKYTGTSDAKGRIKNIELMKDVNYDLVGEKEGNVSDKVLFTTMNVTVKKTYEKSLMIVVPSSSSASSPSSASSSSSSEHAEQVVTCDTRLNYSHNFSYNKNEPEEADDWNRLIKGLVTKSKECNTTVKVLSSASQVPTHSYASNSELAQSRADKLEEKIKAAVTAQGGDAGKITFTKVWAVRGPTYEADYQNTAKYTPYQYVKVICK